MLINNNEVFQTLEYQKVCLTYPNVPGGYGHHDRYVKVDIEGYASAVNKIEATDFGTVSAAEQYRDTFRSAGYVVVTVDVVAVAKVL